MQARNQASSITHSASDLCNYLSCEYLTARDVEALFKPLERDQDSEDAALVQKKGLEHEAAYLQRLKDEGLTVVEIERASVEVMAEKTLEAMRTGAEVIFQATFHAPDFDAQGQTIALLGHADFLRRTPGQSMLGDYHYEVVDTKLAKSTKTKFLVQLIIYSELLAQLQGTYPQHMHVFTGRDGGKMETHQTARYRAVVLHALHRYAAFIQDEPKRIAVTPEPCDHCGFCGWRSHCEKRWEDEDHLSKVANISQQHISKLRKADIHTRRALAAIEAIDPVSIKSGISLHALSRLQAQAALQVDAEVSGKPIHVLLPVEPHKGLGRLPVPHPEDLYFDMEGNPMEEGGSLEYLFGLYHATTKFTAFWALTRAKEKKTFEDFIDYVMAHIKQHPGAHIYHYAAYEQTALKRLMTQYGTREAEVDHILREGLLVDLYQAVREGLRVSEPRYSIKNLERFYLEKRQGSVTNAGASIVFFERWKETGDQQLLTDIELYNKDDVISTMELHRWLEKLRPAGLPYREPKEAVEDTKAAEIHEREAALQARITKLENLVSQLDETDPKRRVHELLGQLLGFHRRAEKPAWWAKFERMKYSDDQLEEDPESLQGLELFGEPEQDKRSLLWKYRYNPQPTKLRKGSQVTDLESGKSLVIHDLDHEARVVTFRLGAKNEMPEFLNIGPGNPLESRVIHSALLRVVDEYLATGQLPNALSDLLYRNTPSVKGLQKGQPLITSSPPKVTDVATLMQNLDASILFIQGPPGTGKTYTGSHVITHLIQQGLRVGVMSNSHHAINNLLHAVENTAKQAKLSFRGVKKVADHDTYLNGTMIADVDTNEAIESQLDSLQLVAGTAWLFARPAFVDSLDVLFVDEAGQVSLANLLACMPSAKSTVLLGDQMQLAQPVQGAHPGDSGLSALDYLLDGAATISPDRGIFLSESWRMAPPITEFISQLVYDGRLTSAASNTLQKIHWSSNGYISQGIQPHPVAHDGNAQSSQEEAQKILEIYQALKASTWTNQQGITAPITDNDILVVAPYNMQVLTLKSLLPDTARVGTVDKFQGQEAAAVLISMATSSQDYLPRDIEFLFSTNRLNVAITRGRAYVGFVYCPDLLLAKASSPEALSLVNTVATISQKEN